MVNEDETKKKLIQKPQIPPGPARLSPGQIARERDNLLNELEKRTRQLSALHETALEITTRRNMPDLLQAIATRAANLLKVPGSSIQIIDPTKEQLHIEVIYGFGKILEKQVIKKGKGITGKVWQTAHPIIVANYDEWPHRLASLPDNIFGSVIAVPIKLGEEVIGVITCHTGAGIYNAFNEEDIQLLESFSRQAAIAIENARLFALERKRSAELEALHQASLRLTSSLEYQPILDAIVKQVLHLVDAEDAHIFLYDGRTLQFGAVAWAHKPDHEPYIKPRQGGLTYTVARSGERLVVPDVNQHPLFQKNPWDWDGSIIGLPLCSGDQVYGVMNIAFNKPYAFDEDDLRILELLADQAAIALQNARLFTSERQHRLQAEILRSAVTSLGQTLQLNTVLDSLLDYLQQLIPYDSATVFMLESGTKMVAFCTQGHENWSSPVLAKSVYFDVRSNQPIKTLLETKKSLLIPDTNNFPGWERPSGSEHVISWLGVPLIVGGEVTGYFSLDKAKQNFFTEEHRRLAESLAGPAAIAIANARLYEQAQKDALTKATLLREVNHRVKNNLTGIIGLLFAARDRAQVSSKADFTAVMNDLIGRIHGLATTHDMFSASGWQPILLTELAERVILNVSRTLPDNKRFSLDIEPSSVKVTANEAHNLALVINELATNSVKHALNRQPEVHVHCCCKLSGNQVHFRYQDDGPGFTTDVLQGKGFNMGYDLIRSIIEENLGGTLSLMNEPGAATFIEFPTYPMEAYEE